ncbi:hypothetical protein GCM10027597_37880 [Saccharopolyspora tripterygii]
MIAGADVGPTLRMKSNSPGWTPALSPIGNSLEFRTIRSDSSSSEIVRATSPAAHAIVASAAGGLAENDCAEAELRKVDTERSNLIDSRLLVAWPHDTEHEEDLGKRSRAGLRATGPLVTARVYQAAVRADPRTEADDVRRPLSGRTRPTSNCSQEDDR